MDSLGGRIDDLGRRVKDVCTGFVSACWPQVQMTVSAHPVVSSGNHARRCGDGEAKEEKEREGKRKAEKKKGSQPPKWTDGYVLLELQLRGLGKSKGARIPLLIGAISLLVGVLVWAVPQPTARPEWISLYLVPTALQLLVLFFYDLFVLGFAKTDRAREGGRKIGGTIIDIVIFFTLIVSIQFIWVWHLEEQFNLLLAEFCAMVSVANTLAIGAFRLRHQIDILIFPRWADNPIPPGVDQYIDRGPAIGIENQRIHVIDIVQYPFDAGEYEHLFGCASGAGHWIGVRHTDDSFAKARPRTLPLSPRMEQRLWMIARAVIARKLSSTGGDVGKNDAGESHSSHGGEHLQSVSSWRRDIFRLRAAMMLHLTQIRLYAILVGAVTVASAANMIIPAPHDAAGIQRPAQLAMAYAQLKESCKEDSELPPFDGLTRMGKGGESADKKSRCAVAVAITVGNTEKAEGVNPGAAAGDASRTGRLKHSYQLAIMFAGLGFLWAVSSYLLRELQLRRLDQWERRYRNVLSRFLLPNVWLFQEAKGSGNWELIPRALFSSPIDDIGDDMHSFSHWIEGAGLTILLEALHLLHM